MLDFIPARNRQVFVKLCEDGLDELISYLSENSEKTIVWINFESVSERTLAELIRLSNIHLKSIHFENNSSTIKLFENVTSLESISFGFEKSRFNFGKLDRLRSIGGVWSKSWENLECCTHLSTFHVSKFKGDFSSIPNLTVLKSITLIQSDIINLSGIESCKQLLELQLAMIKNLVNIDSLNECSCLEILEISSCKNVASYRSIGSLLNLKKLMIIDCKSIESIDFLEKLFNLEFFSISGTTVLDNNLSPCLKCKSLRKVGSDDIKTYSPRIAEVNKLLGPTN